MVRRDLAFPVPAATRAEAVFDVSGARPVSEQQPSPCPTRLLLGMVGQCGGHERCPGRGRRRSRPTVWPPWQPPESGRMPVPAYGLGPAQGGAAAECGLSPAAAPDLGPRRPVRMGHSLPAG